MPKIALPKAITTYFDNLSFRKKNKTGSHMRAHSRHGCVLIAEMEIIEKGFKIDGMVIELSRGGIRFREATSYILDRRGTKVEVSVSGNTYAGVILNIDAHGYGIKLNELMPEEELDKMVSGAAPNLSFGGAQHGTETQPTNDAAMPPAAGEPQPAAPGV